MPANQIAANNDIVGPLTLPAHNSTIAGQIKFNSVTGLNVELYARLSSAAAYKRIKMTDPTTKTDIDALTTDGQIGWAENIGYHDFYFKQTGATAGSGNADMFINVGDDI